MILNFNINDFYNTKLFALNKKYLPLFSMFYFNFDQYFWSFIATLNSPNLSFRDLTTATFNNTAKCCSLFYLNFDQQFLSLQNDVNRFRLAI